MEASADLGEYVCNDPGLVAADGGRSGRAGSIDFGALSQRERVDALLVIAQHPAWLDGLQQQLLAEVSLGDPSEDHWTREEVACAGNSPANMAELDQVTERNVVRR